MFEKNKSIEIVKILLENDKQKFYLRTDVWKNPAAWGLLLVDLAKHIANSISQTNQMNKDEVLKRIREGFDAEWNSPTEKI